MLIDNKAQKKKGFTLIETVVSLMLVLMALAMTCKIVFHTRDAQLKSRARFTLLEEMESLKNRLTALPFSSSPLKPGKYNKHEGEFTIRIMVNTISATLKQVRLVGYHKKYRAVTYKTRFYKSKLIKEEAND